MKKKLTIQERIAAKNRALKLAIDEIKHVIFQKELEAECDDYHEADVDDLKNCVKKLAQAQKI